MSFHTDIPTHTDLERLLSARNGPCVSIYVASSPITAEANAARIELKTLAARAGEQLQAAGTARATVIELGESLGAR